MLNKPRDFTKEDAANYEDLIEATQAIFNLLKNRPNEKPKNNWKISKLSQRL